VNDQPAPISAEESIALLEETLEATHDGLLVLDLDRRIVRYNRHFLRMFGLTAAELDRRGVDAILTALSNQVEDTGELLISPTDFGGDPAIEVLDTLRFTDGRTYEQFIAPHLVGGRIIGRVVSYHDISQIVRAEEAREQYRAFLENAQEVAHIGSWAADLDESGRLVWSAETYRIFGVPRDQFAGTSAAFFAFVHADDLAIVHRATGAAQTGAQPLDIEHRIVRDDGEVRWVHEKADLVRDADGVPTRMVGTVQDITEKRRLEEELRQSQKLEAIGRLAGGIAHDLNNSLTVIIGYTELALNALAEGDAARPDVQEIRRAAERAESVTRQLLAFSRKQMLEPRIFSLGESIANLERMLEHVLGVTITVTTTVPVDLPSIYGDPGQIEQAILNIAMNARDAMPDGGQLTLAARSIQVDEAFAHGHQPMPMGRYVELRVTDTGHGMNAATRARMFEPFFTTKDVGKGTGLGLAMVYGTVRQSGGYIFVDSEPGLGSTFRVYFPPADDRKRDEVKPAPAAKVRTAATVLVVDDEPPIRKLVVTSLRRKGYRVLHAASASDALAMAAAEKGPIDLLLTDASMPGMSGIELAKTLARERPNMLVVVMSGFTEETLNLGGVGVSAVLLPKPFAPSDLLRKVEEVLGARAAALPD
jgi:two-component system, cell cycle sensor histidine kinase and response regulator CckA